MQADESCFRAFNDMKLSHTYKFITFALSSDNKAIVLEHEEKLDASVSNEDAYKKFLDKLPSDAPRLMADGEVASLKQLPDRARGFNLTWVGTSLLMDKRRKRATHAL